MSCTLLPYAFTIELYEVSKQAVAPLPLGQVMSLPIIRQLLDGEVRD